MRTAFFAGLLTGSALTILSLFLAFSARELATLARFQ